jgi:hypothetical protein
MRRCYRGADGVGLLRHLPGGRRPGSSLTCSSGMIGSSAAGMSAR